jgi:hypothetical protein
MYWLLSCHNSVTKKHPFQKLRKKSLVTSQRHHLSPRSYSNNPICDFVLAEYSSIRNNTAGYCPAILACPLLTINHSVPSGLQHCINLLNVTYGDTRSGACERFKFYITFFIVEVTITLVNNWTYSNHTFPSTHPANVTRTKKCTEIYFDMYVSMLKIYSLQTVDHRRTARHHSSGLTTPCLQ